MHKPPRLPLTTGVCAALMIALVLVFGRSGGPEFVPYMPVVWDGDRFVERRDLLNDAHMDRFLVLTAGSNEIRLGRQGQVLIARSLAADPDLLSNYTRKAEDLDPAFVAEHADAARVRLRDTPAASAGSSRR